MEGYTRGKIRYIELVERFDKKIARALKVIQDAPTIYQPTSFEYNGYEIYMRCIEDDMHYDACLYFK